MTSEPAVMLGLTVLLIAIAWFLVAAETAFSRLSVARLEESLANGNRKAAKLLPLASDPARYVNVLLLAHTAVTLAALATLTSALIPLMSLSDGWIVALATAIMSVVTYVVLGVSARTIGGQHPDEIAGAAAGLAKIMSFFLTPISAALILLGNALTPGRGYREGPFASQAELRELVDAAQAASVIEDDERQMIHSVFELGGTIAREVMVPRTEMVFIERDKKLRQAMSLGLRSGFSRIPVIGEDTDDVIGILFLKDIVRRVFEHRDAEKSERVDSIMRPAHFVPDSKPADEMLRDMQANRAHMAIVIDEFGGTAGIVTIEDILEEIVGEIADEYDVEEPEIARLADGNIRLSSRLSLENFSEVTGIELDPDAEGVETIGGLLGKRLGRVPIPGATITEQGWRLVAESAEGRRNRIGTILAQPVAELEPAE